MSIDAGGFLLICIGAYSATFLLLYLIDRIKSKNKK